MENIDTLDPNRPNRESATEANAHSSDEDIAKDTKENTMEEAYADPNSAFN